MSSTSSKPSLYVRSGEKLQRGWLKVLEWDLHKTKLNLNRFIRLNHTSRKPILAAQGPVVSLTTYGGRIQTVYLTLESIAAGTELPSRFLLWLDDESAYRDLPVSLKRLQDRGLEIRLTSNYGPHTKYYPYLESTHSFEEPLVTADDDTIYPRSWLRGLRQSYGHNRSVVSCYRAHLIKFSERMRLATYMTWGRCRSNEPSFLHFGTGVSGCLYPPEFLRELKGSGKDFEQVCPKADDLWLHVNAIRAGYRIKQIYPWQMNYPLLPDTQDMGLAVSNVHAAQNDLQIQNTYTPSDLEILRWDLIE